MPGFHFLLNKSCKLWHHSHRGSERSTYCSPVEIELCTIGQNFATSDTCLPALRNKDFARLRTHFIPHSPNLTVQARQFQENACVRLLRKSKDGRVRPTETGLAFIALARSLLEMRDEVIEALIAIERGEVASVRFGCTALVDRELFRAFCSMHKAILPSATVRPTHGDAAHLPEEILEGAVDAAVITLPLKHPDLHVEELRRDRLVVCLRKDNPLAAKAALQALDLQDNLAILYHPQRHRDAHHRLLELLAGAGVLVHDYSHASHPSEMQTLVKEGHGLALIREGTLLDEQLTTRPIAGVDWTVDTAVIYHKQRRPKTVPILLRKFKKQYGKEPSKFKPERVRTVVRMDHNDASDSPIQLPLLR